MHARTALTLLLAALPVAAALDTPQTFAQIQAAHLSQHNSDCIRKATGLGMGLGQWLTPRWGWEASLLGSRLKDKAGNWAAAETHLHASALYNPFPDLGAWKPFVRAGFGASRLEAPLSLTGSTTIRASMVGGLGTQYWISDHALASLEARGVSIRTSSARTEVQILAGLGARWGASSRPSPPPALAEGSALASPQVPEPAPMPPSPPPAVAEPPKPAQPVAPPQVATLPAPTAAPAAEPPRKFVLGEAVLHFPNNGAELGGETGNAIAGVAAQLKAYPGDYSLVVSGHTSSLGARAHNLALSLRRAQSVAKVLVASGIPAARVKTVGMGPDQPVADDKTREGQSRNRRVEIEVKVEGSVQKVRTDTGIIDTAPAPARGGKPKGPAKKLKPRQ